MSTSFFLPHLHTMPSSLHQRPTLLHDLLIVAPAVYSHNITESSDDKDPACNIGCALDIVQPKTTHFAARTPRRVVYSHDINESNDDNDPAYDIDCALDIIQANGRPPGTSMALVSGCERHLGQASRRGKRHSRTPERQDVGLTKILETGT
jgi:hypothetical protein